MIGTARIAATVARTAADAQRRAGRPLRPPPRGIVRAMKRLPLAALAAALIATAAPARADMLVVDVPDDPVIPFPVREAKLPNGLQVVIVEMRGSGLASSRIVVRTGSRDEYEPGHTGFAHLFEHMMFRGTKKYPHYDEVVAGIGGSANAYTDYDRTVYQVDFASEDLDQVLALESDRFMNLAYDQQTFQTETGAVYGEFRKTRADPEFQLYEAVWAKAFTRHTYAHTPLGFEKDIKAMPTMMAYAKQFFARYYRPENITVVIAGDVDAATTEAAVGKWFGPWKKGYKAPKITAEPEQKAERRVELAYDGRTLPILMLSYKMGAYAPTSVEYASGLVLADLVFGETSPLYKQLVLDEQAVQSLNADAGGNRDPGLFAITAMVSEPGKIDAVTAALEAAIAAAKATPPSPEQVGATVSHLRYAAQMRFDTPARVADGLAFVIGESGSWRAYDDLDATLARVTPETVQRAAAQLLDVKHRTVGILREKQP
jgi:zinc protease